MILSGLVFGRQLRREQVAVRGITAITGREIAEARSAGGRVKHVATLGFAGPEGGSVTASVQPELVRDGDSLAHVDGTANAVVFEASPGRADHHYRPRRRTAAGRAGSPERHHRGREPAGGMLITAKPLQANWTTNRAPNWSLPVAQLGPSVLTVTASCGTWSGRGAWDVFPR
jgi:hypothetical protein